MRRFGYGLLLAVGLALFPAAAVGAAAPATASAPGAQGDPVQECLDRVSPQETMEKGPPSCRLEDGRWVPYWDTGGSVPGSGTIGTLIVVALLWSAVPVILCYTIAQSNGQSAGVAVLLGLFLGWLGLLVVYLMGRSDTHAGAHHVVDALGPQRPFTVPPVPAANGAASAEQRLRALDALRASGAITPEEYDTKRRSILDEL